GSAAAPGARVATAGVRRLPLPRLTRLLVEALFLHVLEQTRAQHLAPELLQGPLDTVAFADLDLDHTSPGSYYRQGSRVTYPQTEKPNCEGRACPAAASTSGACCRGRGTCTGRGLGAWARLRERAWVG